jgi:transcriptional regulator with XRE-family HTH domain
VESTYSFGEWLRRRRRALDLTRDELALRVGCAVVTIKKIESDERRPSRQLAERPAIDRVRLLLSTGRTEQLWVTLMLVERRGGIRRNVRRVTLVLIQWRVEGRVAGRVALVLVECGPCIDRH